MKTDYTITPEHTEASNEYWARRHFAQMEQWTQAYVDARRSHAAGEPLIRTVCKIATRILLVLLVVGIAVGVMAA